MSMKIAAFLFLSLLSLCSHALDDIVLPPGFAIEEYADVPNARSMAMGEQGTLFVGNRKGRAVYAVVRQGDETRTLRVIGGLKSPNGIAVHEGDLYVAEIGRVTRYRDIENHLSDLPKGEVLDIELPTERHHGWRYIAFGPDGKLYISIGAPCNVCDTEGFARIDRMNPDGSEREIFASGIRNSVGFTWQPGTDSLWFTDNGRDMMGDDMPSDELNHAPRPGLHFGFPYCHAGDIPDPKYGDGERCEDYTAPVQKLGAHVAALGIEFYAGTMFPEEYRGQIFLAEHGSWNRSKKAGYRITMVRLDGDEPVSYEPFARGWLQNEAVSGRPVDLLVLADGSMLVSDDFAGKIYRITYSPPTTVGTATYE